MDFLQESKCKCGHLYDFYNTQLSNKEKYFYPPTKHGPLWIDRAKIYQMDPMEDFIKDTVADAVKSTGTTVRSCGQFRVVTGTKHSSGISNYFLP